MNLSQAHLKYPFVRASRTRAGFGHPTSTANFRQFWLWAKKNAPTFYREVKREAPHLITVQGRALEAGPVGLGGLVSDPARIYTYELGLTPSQPIPGTMIAAQAPTTSWGDKLISIAQGAYGLYQQKKIMDINIKRAEKGLPPLEVKDILSPTVKVAVDLPEELQQELTTTTQWLTPLIILGGGFLLWTMMQKGR